PIFQVDLTQGSGQWSDPQQINPSALYHLLTPGNPPELDLLNASTQFLGQTFQAPVAVAVDLQARADQEFDILLVTTDGSGGHEIYKLKLTGSAPPEVDLSTDGNNFVQGGKGNAVNSTWADGASHTLIFVLDGTRLLFYMDTGVLLDISVPLPKTTV